MPVVATTGAVLGSLTCPLVCRQCWGPDVQQTVVFHSCSFRQGGRCPCCQVLGGAAGSALAVVDVPVIMQRRCCLAHLKVPRIQFIAPFEDISVVQQRRVRVQISTWVAGYGGHGGDEGFFL